jgi:taurine dioxygenase
MRIAPMEGPLGARVTGIDLARPLACDTMVALARALYEHRLLAFPGQDLGMAAYEAFARNWGEPYVETYDNMAVPGHPAIMEVGNVGGVLATEAFRNGAAFWHTDRAYAPECDAVTMLYCIHAPAEGGETRFCDLVAAYDALDGATKGEIADLHAFHRYGGGDREEWEFAVHPMSEEQARQLPPPGRHPLARAHSVTGRVGLYAPAGSWIEVEGLDHDAAAALMRRLKLHAIQDRFVTSYRWRPGDLVLWDNTSTLHAAAPIGPAVDDRTRRLLRRIVALGLPAVVRDGGLGPSGIA